VTVSSEASLSWPIRPSRSAAQRRVQRAVTAAELWRQ
jgi:hypothetical protein